MDAAEKLANAIKVLKITEDGGQTITLTEAVTELSRVLSARDYNSRLEIAAARVLREADCHAQQRRRLHVAAES